MCTTCKTVQTKSMRYENQISLQLNKLEPATKEECDEWFEKELKPLADIQLEVVAIMAIIQLLTLVMMLTGFYLIGLGMD